MAGKLGVSMTDPPIRHALPKRQPDVDRNILSQHVAPNPVAAKRPKFMMLQSR